MCETHENILIEYIFMWVYVGASQLQDKHPPTSCWGTAGAPRRAPPQQYVGAPSGHPACTFPTSRGARAQQVAGHAPKRWVGTAPVYRRARPPSIVGHVFFFLSKKNSCPTTCWAQPPAIVGPAPPLLLGPPPFHCWGHPCGNSPASCWGTARGILVESYQFLITHDH